MKKIWIFLLLMSASVHAHAGQNKAIPEHLELSKAINALSLVMMHDVVSPPVAARYYAYAMLGPYHLVALGNNQFPSPGKLIKAYPAESNVSIPAGKADYQVAAYYCLLETGKQMLPSGYLLQAEQDRFLQKLKSKKVKRDVITQSVAVAVEMAAHVIQFAQTDNYNKLSTALRYSPLEGEKNWYPTPPTYMEAVEPHWRTVKPFIINSPDQFKSLQPVAYSQDAGSPFYVLAKEVYDVTNSLSPEQLEAASFWDCNPFAVTTSGHMAIGFKKISPGGHWMNIACIATQKAALDFDATVLVLSVEAFTLMDAFIACWDEKYTSNRIRPETYINRYLDKKWAPLLQTPPFPEYTSGHAVVSNASAEVLTYLLGEDFSYTDDSEVMFEISPRSFGSFRKAAAEASISRLYGGIHFRDSIENGNAQGQAIGSHIVSKIVKVGIRPVYGF